jgi:spermidine/putrescine transport system permease protein
VGAASTVAATVLGLLSALAIVRHNFRGKSVFLVLTVMPMLAPGIIMGVSLLLFARFVGFQTGFVAVLLGHVLLALPYCTFILISSLARFDRSLEEAARGLGASEAGVLWRVTLPGIAPGIVGEALFAFTISIGEFVVSFFLTSAGTTTLPIRIYSIVKVGITPEINAVSSLILLATAVLSVAALRLTWSKRN